MADTFCPVIDLDRARRVRAARHLQALGCPLEQVTATTSDTELVELVRRWELIGTLCRLTGGSRPVADLYPTAQLEHLVERTVGELMTAPGARCNDAPVYRFTGRYQARHAPAGNPKARKPAAA